VFVNVRKVKILGVGSVGGIFQKTDVIAWQIGEMCLRTSCEKCKNGFCWVKTLEKSPGIF